MNFPIISSLILLPTIGAFFLFFSRSSEKNNNTVKYVALFTSFVNFFDINHINNRKNTSITINDDSSEDKEDHWALDNIAQFRKTQNMKRMTEKLK